MCDEETGGALEVALRDRETYRSKSLGTQGNGTTIAVKYIDDASIIGIASFEWWRYE